MSVEVLEVQAQLEKARDNLRHVEEGIKKTSTSNFRFGGDGAGRGRGGGPLGRRIGPRFAGAQRFREEEEGDYEPPAKKALSSVASRLGPINTVDKDDKENDEEEEEEDTPTLMSTVQLSATHDRENASSVVSDTKTLDRSKRLFGSLLMGTLRKFKQDKEKTKTSDNKQAEVLDKIQKKAEEHVAMTAEDRRRLVAAKDEMNEEIRLLEEQMEITGMKVRAIEERDTYSPFIQTKVKPHLFYLPKEHTEQTMKSLQDSNHRLAKEYDVRIEGYNRKLSVIKAKLEKTDGGVKKKLGELSTIKIEKITKTITNENAVCEKEGDDKGNNPHTGIKVEVQLRNSDELKKDEVEKEKEKETSSETDTPDPPRRPKSNPAAQEKRSRSLSPRKKRRGRDTHPPGRSPSHKSKQSRSRSPRNRSNSPRRRAPVNMMAQNPAKKSRSPVKRSNSRKSRSPVKRSNSRKSRSPVKQIASRRSPHKRNMSRGSKSPAKSSKSPVKRVRSPVKRTRSPRRRSKSPRKRSSSPKRRPRSPARRPVSMMKNGKISPRKPGPRKDSTKKRSKSVSSSGSSSGSSRSESDSD